VNDENVTIEYLVGQYRAMTVQIKKIEAERKGLKSSIEMTVRALEGLKWKDTDGHAVIKTRRASVSYPGKEVDNLVKVWAESNDAIMQSCGQMLQNLRRESQKSEYLEVR